MFEATVPNLKPTPQIDQERFPRDERVYFIIIFPGRKSEVSSVYLRSGSIELFCVKFKISSSIWSVVFVFSGLFTWRWGTPGR